MCVYCVSASCQMRGKKERRFYREPTKAGDLKLLLLLLLCREELLLMMMALERTEVGLLYHFSSHDVNQ
jgi:hypothetical protein